MPERRTHFEKGPRNEQVSVTDRVRRCAGAGGLFTSSGRPREIGGFRHGGGAESRSQALPDSGFGFPIANAVEVPAETTLVFLSGKTPAPAKPDAEKFSAEFWGDTETQTVSALTRIQETLAGMGLNMGDVVKMQAFLVGVPEADGMLDFDGFMAGYTQFFGGEAQAKLPARTTVQVAGLAAPGMLVEIDVIVAKP